MTNIEEIARKISNPVRVTPRQLGPYHNLWPRLAERQREVLYWYMRGYKGDALAHQTGVLSRSTTQREIEAFRRAMIDLGHFESIEEITSEAVIAKAIDWLIELQDLRKDRG